MADRLKGKVAIVTGAGSSGPGVGNGKCSLGGQHHALEVHRENPIPFRLGFLSNGVV